METPARQERDMKTIAPGITPNTQLQRERGHDTLSIDNFLNSPLSL